MKTRSFPLLLCVCLLPVSGPACLRVGGTGMERPGKSETAAAARSDSTERESPWTFLWVKTPRADLREGPGEQYYLITPIVKGARLIILSKYDDWYQVNLRSASIIGWIHESAVSEEEVPREE